ncbi:MAG: hypothetical protein HQ559_13470 [Lentisphaerae bacterium]|nr:hypothetical protein [Lentisphaerota bacterium]
MYRERGNGNTKRRLNRDHHSLVDGAWLLGGKWGLWIGGLEIGDLRLAGQYGTRLFCIGFAAAVLCAGSVCGEPGGGGGKVAVAFAEKKRICGELERIRSLSFRTEVRAEAQSAAAFRAYVTEAVSRQFGEAEAEAYVETLVTLGVLKETVDLTGLLLDLLESQAAAYYDPEKDVYFLLATNLPPGLLDVVSSHELCHALHDQHYDLHEFIEGDIAALRDNGDAGAAKQCLVEGDATLVMMTWMIMRQMALQDHRAAEPIASLSISGQAAMDFDTVLELAEGGLANGDAGMASMGSVLADLKDYPRFFVEMLYATYIRGAFMVDFVKSRGGWDAVNALYADPPVSTEQVLHPEKLLGNRERPLDASLPQIHERVPDPWRLVETDVLGELGIRLMLETWRDRDTEESVAVASAAEGWGGDRYYFFKKREGKGHLLVWKTRWDSRDDAGEYAVSYRLALETRFPKRKAGWTTRGGKDEVSEVWEIEPGRYLKLSCYRSTVGIIDTTDRSLLDVMWR